MSDEIDLRTLIISMKTEILNKIETRNVETERNINTNILAIKQDVQTNKEEIDRINIRLDKLENVNNKKDVKETYADAVKKEVTKTNFFQEARKIIGLLPINNRDIERNMEEGVDKKDAIRAAVDEFLRLELKMNSEEIKDLNIKDISRPNKEDSDRVYLHCVSGEGPQYIMRKIYKSRIKISR